MHRKYFKNNLPKESLVRNVMGGFGNTNIFLIGAHGIFKHIKKMFDYCLPGCHACLPTYEYD
jgi:hypothetical protein